ncbi:MAG: SDR family NAD(P)-dependent oxidoreductase [Bacillus sp. (in: firmicutes)]
MEFQDKVVIITGATSGVGKEMTKQFSKEGALLTLVDLDIEKLQQTVGELGLSDETYILVQADVTDEEQVQTFVRKTTEFFGDIDVFVNNAGVEGAISPLSDYPVDELNRVIDVNIKGTFYGLKHVLKVMQKQKSGSIVTMASTGGLKGMPATSAFVASKSAIIGLTKTAALENAEYGIRINALAPSMVNTQKIMHHIEDDLGHDAKEKLEHLIPLGRYAEPEDVARAAVFLASEKASYITGVVLPVDGGFSA